MTDEAPLWAEFPSTDSRPPWYERMPAVAAWLLAVAGPLVAGRTSLSGIRLLVFLGVTWVLARWAGGEVGERSSGASPALVAAGAAGLVGTLVGGLSLGVAVAVGGAIAALTALRSGGEPSDRAGIAATPMVLSATLGTALAARLLTQGGSPVLLLVPPVVVLALSLVVPASASRGAALVERVAAWAGSLVVVVFLSVVGVVVVVLPWAVQRLVRWDPTWIPRPSGSRWVPRSPRPGDPKRIWDPDPRLVATTPGRRLHRLVGILAVLLPLALMSGAAAWTLSDRANRDQYDVAALEGQPWFYDGQWVTEAAAARGEVTDFHGVILPDTRSEYVNIADGARATWQPPEAQCPPVDVWMMGGSAMFGLGQRDDGTIASWLARLAWDEGIALHIENRGVPADVHWIEGRRVEAALADGTPPPDMVIFYDGLNDFDVQRYLNGVGLGGARIFGSYPDGKELKDQQRLSTFVANLTQIWGPTPDISLPDHPPLDDDDLVRFSAEGYAAAGESTARLLEDHGIERAWFYQPSRNTRSVPVPGEEEKDPEFESPESRKLVAAFRSQLPEDVIDLGSVMDPYRMPLYYDWVHTNERGARVVAAAMLEHLLPQLRDLQAGGEGVPCR